MAGKSKRGRATARRALPGDAGFDKAVARMIRVDHAGEYGAARIYAGQIAVLGEGRAGPALREMARQEHEHLAAFEKLVAERRVRPTVLQPLWHVAGYALGAATAALGVEAAMACTVAVEETIVEHYGRQLDELGADEPELRRMIARFRDDEDHHRRTGLEHGAEKAPSYPLLRAVIRAGSRAAIRLSEKI